MAVRCKICTSQKQENFHRSTKIIPINQVRTFRLNLSSHSIFDTAYSFICINFSTILHLILKLIMVLIGKIDSFSYKCISLCYDISGKFKSIFPLKLLRTTRFVLNLYLTVLINFFIVHSLTSNHINPLLFGFVENENRKLL